MIMNWQNKIAEQVSSIPRSGIREFDLVTDARISSPWA